MANIYLTETAQFKPFSYQEMLAPVKSYTDAYNALEDEMTNLDIMAGDVAGKLTQNPEDAELRNIYNRFQTDMQTAMNNLYNNGYNSTTRKQLAGLKARYAKELNPINEAYKAYQEDQKYLNKMAIEHPEIIIKNKSASISDYMHGNRPNLSGIDTNELRDEALKIAEQQSTRTYREDPNWTSTAGGRALERSAHIGLKDEDFANALVEIQSGDITSTNARLIKESIDSVLGTVNTEGLTTNEAIQIYNSIVEGVRAGFKYKKDTKVIDDPLFEYNLKNSGNGVPPFNIPTMYPTEDIDRGSITDGKHLTEQNDFVKTLLTTSNGVTTATAVARESEMAQLEAELQDLVNTYGIPTESLGKSTEESISSKTNIGSAAGLAGMMNASTSKRKTFTKEGRRIDVNSTNNVAYDRYFEIKDRLAKIPSEIQSELDVVNTLRDKYGHLHDDLQTAITIGNQLELNQSAINGIYVKPIIDPTLDKKVKTVLLDLASGAPEGSIKEINEKGDIKEFSDDELFTTATADDFVIFTTPALDNPNMPNPVVLRHKETQKDFVLTTNSTLNNFASSYKKQTSFIRDYSKEGLSTPANLPIDAFNLAVNYGIVEGESYTTVLAPAIKNAAKNTRTALGHNRFGYTISTQSSNNAPANIYKIITEATPYGEVVVGVSSLNNESAVHNGGLGSGTFAKSESQRYINDLIKVLEK